MSVRALVQSRGTRHCRSRRPPSLRNVGADRRAGHLDRATSACAHDPRSRTSTTRSSSRPSRWRSRSPQDACAGLRRASRLLIGFAFFENVIDRLGFIGPPGAPGVSWGDFPHFIAYTAQVNAFAPPAIIPALAVLATIAEGTFALTMLLGLRVRLAAAGSAAAALRLRQRDGALGAFTASIRRLSHVHHGVGARDGRRIGPRFASRDSHTTLTRRTLIGDFPRRKLRSPGADVDRERVSDMFGMLLLALLCGSPCATSAPDTAIAWSYDLGAGDHLVYSERVRARIDGRVVYGLTGGARQALRHAVRERVALRVDIAPARAGARSRSHARGRAAQSRAR